LRLYAVNSATNTRPGSQQTELVRNVSGKRRLIVADHAELRAEFQGWLDAYPLTMFPEPDLKRAAEVLKAAGMTLDSISASNMRHVAGLIAPKAIALLDEVEALRLALAFYRDEWINDVDAERTATGWTGSIGPLEPTEALLTDRGEKARAALASRPPAEEAATQEKHDG
jgi:hypothetical protein